MNSAACLVAVLAALLVLMVSPSEAYTSGYDMPLKYQVDGFTLYNMNTSAYCYYDCDPTLLYPSKCPMSCMPSNRTNLQLFNIVSNLNKDIQKNCWVRPRSIPGQLSPYDGKKLCFPKNASGVGGLPAQDGDVHCNFVVGNNPLRQWDWFQLEKFGGGITAGLDNIYPGDYVRIKYNRTAIIPNDGGYCRGFVDESRFNCKIQNAWEADVFQLGFMSNLDHYNGDNNCCCQADSW